MQICGFQKTTLLDYPSHLAATVFLGGCNFRCPFCHNYDLIHGPFQGESFSEEEILSYLKKRQSILEGVCITGGEPTLNPDLPDFIRRVKALGFLIKLDTNGSNPDMLKDLYEENLIDYVAMDIKSGLLGYLKVCGLDGNEPKDGHAACDLAVLHAVKESIHFLIHETNRADFSYEFRTTLVKGLHTTQDIAEIASLIQGAKAHYLQNYRPCDNPNAIGFSSFTPDELNSLSDLLKQTVAHVEIRSGE